MIVKSTSTAGRVRSAAIAFGFAASLALGGWQSARADVVLDTGSNANDQYTNKSSGDTQSRSLTVTSLPFSQSDRVENGGQNYAESDLNLSSSVFSISFAQGRDGAQNSSATSYGWIYFHPTDDTTSYSIGGSYTFSTPYAYFGVELYDQTTGQDVQAWNQTSNDWGASGDTFTAGGSEGEGYGGTGSLAGSLTKNDSYVFFYQLQIEAFPNPDAGATATGNVSLNFADDSAVAAAPLPTSASAGLSLLGLLCAFEFFQRRQVQCVNG